MLEETEFSAFEIGVDDSRLHDKDKVNYCSHTGPNLGAEILSGEMREIAGARTGL